jgi:hypothetical protein
LALDFLAINFTDQSWLRPIEKKFYGGEGRKYLLLVIVRIFVEESVRGIGFGGINFCEEFGTV